MKNVFESVIRKGDYDLTEILRRIDEYHIEGKLTDEERDSLYKMARGDVKPQYDFPKEIERLWAAIRELQKSGVTEEQPDETEVPEYVNPTGAHDAYQTGDRVKYNGKFYESIIDNNVWSPDVYPSGWEIIE